jgi:proteasome lid subunit RPN8/RPN11
MSAGRFETDRWGTRWRVREIRPGVTERTRIADGFDDGTRIAAAVPAADAKRMESLMAAQVAARMSAMPSVNVNRTRNVPTSVVWAPEMGQQLRDELWNACLGEIEDGGHFCGTFDAETHTLLVDEARTNARERRRDHVTLGESAGMEWLHSTEVVGDFHYHPEGFLEPSDVDLSGWRDCGSATRWLGVIVTWKRRWQARAWLVERGELREITPPTI